MAIMLITGKVLFFQHANSSINHCLRFTLNHHVHSECLSVIMCNYLAWLLLHSGALEAFFGNGINVLDMSNVIILPFLSV